MKVYVGKNDDGTPKLEDARRGMTMRELMTHTAGLGYVLSPNNPVDKMIIDGRVLNADAPLQAMIDGLGKTPLLAQPGTRWSYSIAVDVQGYLVEKFSGQPFADFARTRIFEPLGMKDTGFYVPKEKLTRFSEVHTGAGPALAVDGDVNGVSDHERLRVGGAHDLIVERHARRRWKRGFGPNLQFVVVPRRLLVFAVRFDDG